MHSSTTCFDLTAIIRELTPILLKLTLQDYSLVVYFKYTRHNMQVTGQDPIWIITQ